MALYEIAFKLQRESHLSFISQRFPDFTFAIWCNTERDVIEIRVDREYPQAVERLQDALAMLKNDLALKVMRTAVSAAGAHIVTRACVCMNFSNAIVQKHNCLKIDPVFLKGGWGWYRILAYSQADVRSLFGDLERLGTVKLVSRRALESASTKDTFVVSAAGLLGCLTKRQSLALLVALTQGYYQIPKKVTTDDIARSLGLPRSTYEDHLRKAESKTLNAILPLLQFSGPSQSKTKNQRGKGKMVPQLLSGRKSSS